MINLTKVPKQVEEKISSRKLDSLIRDAVREQAISEADELGASFNAPPERDDVHQFTFSYLAKELLNKRSKFNFEWILTAYTYLSSADNEIKQGERLDAILFRAHCFAPGMYAADNGRVYSLHRAAVVRVKRSLRILMLRLWSRGIIVLPLDFDLGRYAYRGPLLTEVATFIAQADDPDLHNRGLRIILASSWHTFEAVNLEELSELHRLTLSGNKDGLFSSFKGRMPFGRLLSALLESSFRHRLAFTDKDVESYLRWTRGDYFLRYSFKDFLAHFEEIRAEAQSRYAC